MANEEEYLYLLEYAVEGENQSCYWFEYFKSLQEMKKFLEVYSAPHIRPLLITACTNGSTWHNRFLPYKKSEYDALYRDTSAST